MTPRIIFIKGREGSKTVTAFKTGFVKLWTKLANLNLNLYMKRYAIVGIEPEFPANMTDILYIIPKFQYPSWTIAQV